MPQQFESSVVQIINSVNQIVGTGFLVSKKHILTCAHVVQAALSLNQLSEMQPEAILQIGFPRVAPQRTYNAKVIFWKLNQFNTHLPPEDKQDIALLELENIPPKGVQPMQLATTEDWWEHSFRVFGFPGGVLNGRWARGNVLGIIGDGSVQIESRNNQGYPIVEGFSGAPVWDDDLKSVVGIVVEREKKESIAAAFILPTQLLVKLCPKLVTLAAVPRYSETVVDVNEPQSSVIVYFPEVCLQQTINETLWARIIEIYKSNRVKKSDFQALDIVNMSFSIFPGSFRVDGAWKFQFRERVLHTWTGWLPKRGTFYIEFPVGANKGKLKIGQNNNKIEVISGENPTVDQWFNILPSPSKGLYEAFENFIYLVLQLVIFRDFDGKDIHQLLIQYGGTELAHALKISQQEVSEFLAANVESINVMAIEGGLLITLQCRCLW